MKNTQVAPNQVALTTSVVCFSSDFDLNSLYRLYGMVGMYRLYFGTCLEISPKYKAIPSTSPKQGLFLLPCYNFYFSDGVYEVKKFFQGAVKF